MRCSIIRAQEFGINLRANAALKRWRGNMLWNWFSNTKSFTYIKILDLTNLHPEFQILTARQNGLVESKVGECLVASREK